MPTEQLQKTWGIVSIALDFAAAVRRLADRLADDPDAGQLVARAAHPAVERPVPAAPSGAASLRFRVAPNHFIIHALARMASYPDPRVRAFVAGQPATPARVLATLAEDPACHHQLAGNPSTPPEVLARLAESDDPEVAGQAVRHPRMPGAALLRLAAREGNTGALARERLGD